MCPLPTAVFLVIYVFNVLRGRAVNAYLAKKWAETFTQPGGIYDKNFSSLSAGVSNELMRVSHKHTHTHTHTRTHRHISAGVSDKLMRVR